MVLIIYKKIILFFGNSSFHFQAITLNLQKEHVRTLLIIYKIKDLIASNGPLISRGIYKRRLKRGKTV